MSPPYPLPPTAHRRVGPEVIRATELYLGSSEQQSWPCPSPTAALREAVSAPYLDNTVELLLDVGVVGKQALKV